VAVHKEKIDYLTSYVKRCEGELKIYQATYPELRVTSQDVTDSVNAADAANGGDGGGGAASLPPWLAQSKYTAPLLMAYETRLQQLTRKQTTMLAELDAANRAVADTSKANAQLQRELSNACEQLLSKLDADPQMAARIVADARNGNANSGGGGGSGGRSGAEVTELEERAILCRWCDCSCHVHLCSHLCCSLGGATALVTRSFVFSAPCARKFYDQYATSHSAHANLTNRYATVHTTDREQRDILKMQHCDLEAKLTHSAHVNLTKNMQLHNFTH
jgi:hypothetical protein